jgi:protease I
VKVSEARVVVLVANLYQEIEFWYPVMRFKELGARVTIASMATGETYGSKLGYPVQADVSVDDIDPSQFDALIIPGGLAPEALRTSAGVLDLVRKAFEQDKIVAAICHAPWVLVSAGVIQGRRVTSVGPVRDDVINGGGNWVDQSIVVDGHLVTGQLPNDVPPFCQEIIALLESVPAPDGAQPELPRSTQTAEYARTVTIKTAAVAPGSANYLMFAE